MRAAVLAFAVLLAGCEEPERVCVRGHNDLILIPTFIGGTMYLQQHWVWTCDETGPNPKYVKKSSPPNALP